ncbi:hypothetical protein, partial [Eoetvoesiella caeni]|uniref:hypothetical protein n=1 Tax=Eoetvoesiella caeni TaxID=645616 RepID=UPI0035EFBE4D
YSPKWVSFTPAQWVSITSALTASQQIQRQMHYAVSLTTTKQKSPPCGLFYAVNNGLLSQTAITMGRGSDRVFFSGVFLVTKMV